jgi:hypothetical protein
MPPKAKKVAKTKKRNDKERKNLEGNHLADIVRIFKLNVTFLT